MGARVKEFVCAHPGQTAARWPEEAGWTAPAPKRERMPRDGFLRETFVLPRTDARDKAKEWFDRWPKQAYWTEIESWFERPGDMIEFTIRRLPAAD